VKTIDFTGLGENLLNKSFIEILKYAKLKKITIEMTDNFCLMNEEISKELLKIGISVVVVSIDGATKKTYEKIRVGGESQVVKKNCLNFIELKKSRKLSYPVIKLSFIKMEINKKEIKGFINFWKDKVNCISIQKYINFKGFLQENKNIINDNFVCPQPFQRLVVQWDGTVMPCCADINNTLKLGSARKNSLKKIWNSRKLEAIRKLHLNHKHYKISTCRTCYVNKNGPFQEKMEG